MPQYLIADGFNVGIDDLDPIVPQPRSTAGVQAAQRDFGADGSVWEQGLYIVLEWSSIGSASAYQTLLEQLGLDNALRNAVTLYAPNFERTWARYNGYAVRPNTVNYATFLRNVRIVVNRLELSS